MIGCCTCPRRLVVKRLHDVVVRKTVITTLVVDGPVGPRSRLEREHHDDPCQSPHHRSCLGANSSRWVGLRRFLDSNSDLFPCALETCHSVIGSVGIGASPNLGTEHTFHKICLPARERAWSQLPRGGLRCSFFSAYMTKQDGSELHESHSSLSRRKHSTGLLAFHGIANIPQAFHGIASVPRFRQKVCGMGSMKNDNP